MKVIGYTRVSTNEQAESGVSLAAQAERIRAYCVAQGWECVEVVVDDGYSAKNLRRPGLVKILDETKLKSRRFEGIVAVKLDRLTRSVKDLSELTDEMRRRKVNLVLIQEAVDTSTATGQLFHNIVAAISEWERGMIGERTREAMAHKRRRGERIGAVPFGWSLAADGKRLEPIPEELELIEAMRKQNETGMSLKAIARVLNAEGVKSKTGGRWYGATVKSVLETAAKMEAARKPRLAA